MNKTYFYLDLTKTHFVLIHFNGKYSNNFNGTQITWRNFLLESDAVPREVLDGHGVDSFLLVVVHHGNLDRAKNHKYNLESILESLTLNYLAETGNFSLTSFISASV